MSGPKRGTVTGRYRGGGGAKAGGLPGGRAGSNGMQALMTRGEMIGPWNHHGTLKR